MSESPRDQLYQEIEATEEPLSLDLTREKMFREAAHSFAKDGDSESARLCLAESLLFGCHQSETDDVRAFLHSIATIGNANFGDPMMVPMELVPYIETRLSQVTSPHLRARYADFLWQKIGGHEFARASVDAHADLVRLEASRGNYHHAADSARRALRLAYALGDPKLREATEDQLTTMCKAWSESEASALFLDNVAEVIASSSRPRPDLLNEWGEILSTALSNTSDHRIRRDLFGALARIQDKTGRTTEARASRAALGDEWVAEAEERREESALVAAKFYDEAFNAYTTAGESEKAREVKKLVRSTYSAAESEFGEISHQMTLDLKPWLKEVTGWTSFVPEDALTRFAATIWLMPDWDEAESSSSNLTQTAPLSQLIPVVTLDDGRPVAQPRSEEEQHEDNVRRQYHWQLALRSIYLSAGLSTLREEMNMTADDFIRTLERSPFFSGRDLSIERAGFERYLEGDPTSALHILVPRIEEAIRRQAGALGADTTSVRQGIMTEKSLDQLLEDQTTQALLEKVPRLHRYLRELLIEQSGPNLRHKIAHGIISSDKCNQENADRIVHLYLVLSLFRASPTDTDDAESQSRSS